MKCYKLKENNFYLYNLERIITEDERKNIHGGFFSLLGTFEDSLCKSLELLKQKIYEYEFKYEIDEEDQEEVSKCFKLVDEIISRAGIETYEVEYPNIPGIVIEIEELTDQFECDANRTPKLYLKSLSELENLELNGLYEIYSIKKNGEFKFEPKFSTYRLLE